MFEDSSLSFVDDFLGTPLAQTGEVRVCDTTYRCRADDGVSYWSADAEESTSRACKVDGLAAAAHANKCTVDHLFPPEGCRVDNPLLRDASGTLHLIHNESTTGLPRVIDGSLACVNDTVTKDTHVPIRAETLGATAGRQLSMVVMKTRDEIEAEAAAAPEEPVAATPVQEEGTPVREEEEPALPTWSKCHFETYSTKRACAADAECPLLSNVERDMVWSKARELQVPLDGGLRGFMESMKAQINDELEWSDVSVAGLHVDDASEAKLKSSLRILWDSDETFRASAQKMLHSDPDFSASVAQAKSGLCAAGVCKDHSVTPTTRLYTGPGDTVSFQLLENDKVTYTKNGELFTTRAYACTPNASEEVAKLCEEASVDVHATKTQAPTLDAQAVQSSYRVHFSDGKGVPYVVMNRAEALDPAECPARLCALNADACPAPTCRIDEGKCVPK